MKKISQLFFLLFVGLMNIYSQSDELSIHYEELTAPDFIKAAGISKGVCIIPFGIIEKHGPHLPLGTDIYISREISEKAAAKDYCIVFPWYYFGQINEAKHQPGAIAYSHETIWNLLQETCDELSRNGLKKIIIVNGHGGNNDFLRYFCMSQLENKKDYILLLFQPQEDSIFDTQIKVLSKTDFDGHAGEQETSMIQVIHPDLIKKGASGSQSGSDQNLLRIPNQYTGIWWYSHYPNHYAGNGDFSSIELGGLLVNHYSDLLVDLIRTIKKDNTVENLMNIFYKQSEDPLKTQQ